MAIGRIVAERSLSKILDLKAVPARSVRKNPFLGRGYLPYDHFVDSLLAATVSTKSSCGGSRCSGEMLYDAIMEIASDGPTEASLRLLQDEGLRLVVFHGTNEAVMDDTMKTGLLPEFRESGNKEWFEAQYTVGMKFASAMIRVWESIKLLFLMECYGVKYTRIRLPAVETTVGKATKLLIVMVLSGQADSLSTQITSDSNRFQLPVAEIKLKNVENKVLLEWFW